MCLLVLEVEEEAKQVIMVVLEDLVVELQVTLVQRRDLVMLEVTAQ